METPYASRVLRKLSRDEAFYFFTSIGNYTGQSASSLEEFLDKIGHVDIKSLEFHHQRGARALLTKNWMVFVFFGFSLGFYGGPFNHAEKARELIINEEEDYSKNREGCIQYTRKMYP